MRAARPILGGCGRRPRQDQERPDGDERDQAESGEDHPAAQRAYSEAWRRQQALDEQVSRRHLR